MGIISGGKAPVYRNGAVSRAARDNGDGTLAGCWIVNIPIGISDDDASMATQNAKRVFYDADYEGREAAEIAALKASGEFERLLEVDILWSRLPCADRDTWRRRYCGDEEAYNSHPTVAHFYAAFLTGEKNREAA